MDIDPIIAKYIQDFAETFRTVKGDVECDRRTPQSVPVTPEVICLPYEPEATASKPSSESRSTAP
jgi:hypothetical protein